MIGEPVCVQRTGRQGTPNNKNYWLLVAKKYTFYDWRTRNTDWRFQTYPFRRRVYF